MIILAGNMPADTSLIDARRVRSVILGLVLLSAAAFSPVFWCGFVNYDDDQYLVRNPLVAAHFSMHVLAAAMRGTTLYLYHPASTVSFMLEHAVWGMQPAGYHAVSLGIHCASIVLLFLFLNKWTGSTARAGLAAALWGVHPLRVESVAWISERKDVLSIFFLMLVLLCYARYTRAAGFRRWSWYGAQFLFLAMAMLAKPAFIALPALMLLLDYWPLGRWNLTPTRRLVALAIEKLPIFAFVLIWTLLALRRGDADSKAMHAAPRFFVPTAAMRYSNAAITFVRFLGKQIWPVNLAVPYPFPRDGWKTSLTILAVGSILLLTVLALSQYRRRSYLTFGWLWFSIALAPMIGIVAISDYAMADRYSYLPSIGLVVIVAWALPARWFTNPQSRRRAITVTGGVILVLSIITANQASYWHDSLSLFEHTIAVTSSNALAENHVGEALFEKRDYDGAIVHLQKAIDFSPGYAVAHYNLGCVLIAQGNFAAARDSLERAIELDRYMTSAHDNLGALYAQLGQTEAAEREFHIALDLDPDDSHAHLNFGRLLMQEGKAAEAQEEFHIAVQVEPTSAEAQFVYGSMLANAGNRAGAIEHLTEALRLEPRLIAARRTLAMLEARQ